MNQQFSQVIEVNAQLQWQFYKDEPSGRWIGVCDPLKLCIEADTTSELRENIEDALGLLFRNLFKDNEFDSFLRARGWTSKPTNQAAASDDIEFDVPFEMIRRNGYDSARMSH